jgi:hypothetical protein
MQKISRENNWTVVVRGQWNVRIFTPEWVAANLLSEAQFEVQAELMPGIMALRYADPNILFFPGEDALMIVARQRTAEALSRMEEVAGRALNILQHTPVSGFGINFEQFDQDVPPSLQALVGLPDEDDLVRAGWVPQAVGIGRQLVLNDDIVLNARYEVADDGAGIALNFHFPAGSAVEAASRLNGQTVRCREIAESFLREVYQIELKTEEAHEPV